MMLDFIITRLVTLFIKICIMFIDEEIFIFLPFLNLFF